LGHRKVHAPRRGSLAYLPRGRAKRWRARIRHWPEIEGNPRLLAFSGYKVGMAHLLTIEDKKGSFNFGKEVALPVTLIDSPPMMICAVRAYEKSSNGLRTLTEAWAQNPSKSLGRLLSAPKTPKTEEALKKLEGSLGKIHEIRVLATTRPELTNVLRKTPEIIEIKVSGGAAKEQFEYAKSILGKELKVSDVFQPGQWVDVAGITKGKGIQGPVKRWGIRKKFHKSRKTVRQVGCIGGWNPSFVQYTVPRAGQMGFHQRISYSQQIVKIGEDPTEVNPKGGFIHSGPIKGSYLMLAGSVSGPSRRLVTLRYAARAKIGAPSPPKVEYLSIQTK